MKYNFYILYCLVFILVLIAFPNHTKADQVLIPKSVSYQVPSYTVEQVQEAVISACAIYKGCDKDVALAIVQAENDYGNGQSLYPNPNGPNGREDSWGVAQINLYWNPSITRTQAQNLYFSANFLAKNLAAGKCALWSTCPLQ